MIRSRWGIKQVLFTIILAICLSFSFVSTAQAQTGIPPRDSVPAGQTIEGDTLLFGQTVTVDGNVTGDLFIIGSDVRVNGDIGGSLYIVAENIIVNGMVGGSTYQGGLEIQLGSETSIERNAYLLGMNLSTDRGAIVSNDFYAAGLQAWLSGEVGRYMRSVIVVLNVEGKIGNGIDKPDETSPQGEEDGATSSLGGVLALIRLEGPLEEYFPLQQRSFGSIDTIEDETFLAQQPSDPAVDWILNYLRKLITLLVFGGLIIWLFPRYLTKWSEKIRSKPLSAGLWGIVVVIFAGLVALVLASLIPALVILLWKITFWGLASVILAFGFTGLGLAGILFLISAVYISKVIISFLIGDLILSAIAPRIAKHRIWPLLLGAVIMVALRQIPSVGWVFGLLAALIGLGAIWLVYRETDAPTQMLDVDTEAEQTLVAESAIQIEDASNDIMNESDDELAMTETEDDVELPGTEEDDAT